EEFWNLLKEDFLFGIENNHLPDQYASDDVGRITIGAARSMLGKAMLYKHYHYYVRNGQKGSQGDVEDLKLARELFQTVTSSGTYQLIQPKEPKTPLDYTQALLSNTSWVTLPAGDNTYPSENNRESVWEVQY